MQLAIAGCSIFAAKCEPFTNTPPPTITSLKLSKQRVNGRGNQTKDP